MKSIKSLSLTTTALLCAAPITYAVDLAPVLVQTQSVPGDAGFGFFDRASSLTGLSNTRKVVTWNGWNGASQFADSGIFTWQNVLLSDVLRSNDVANAPGLGQPVSHTQPAFIDDNGNVAVPATFSVDQDSANFVGANRAGLSLVNRVGGANAPGNAQPWNPFVDVVANNDGQMAFYGRVGNTNLGVWRGTSAANLVRLAQATVTLIPGTAFPVTDVSFETPMINSSGLSLIDVGYGVGEQAVLIGTSDANLQVIARTNNLDVPGLPAGTKFSDVTKHSINNAGHTVIGGSWDNGSHSGTFNRPRHPRTRRARRHHARARPARTGVRRVRRHRPSDHERERQNLLHRLDRLQRQRRRLQVGQRRPE